MATTTTTRAPSVVGVRALVLSAAALLVAVLLGAAIVSLSTATETADSTSPEAAATLRYQGLADHYLATDAATLSAAAATARYEGLAELHGRRMLAEAVAAQANRQAAAEAEAARWTALAWYHMGFDAGDVAWGARYQGMADDS